jgi:tetratricopeptide (TPR) repeat protein
MASERWCQLAAERLEAGAPLECLDAAKRAIVLGERSWAHRLASLALLDLGRVAEAVASAREAVHREPGDWRCHVTLAEALAAEPGGPVGDALAAARRAVDLAPDQPRTNEILGDVALRAQDWPLAKRAYMAARRLDPANDRVRVALRQLAGVGVDTESDAGVDPADAERPTGVRVRRPPSVAVRTAWWLLLRRTASWLAGGTFVLLIAGMPSPRPVLAWFALALVLLVGGLAGLGWLRLPRGLNADSRQVLRASPGLTAGVGLLGLGLLALTVWTAALALGARGMHLLTLALFAGVAALAVGWFGLRGAGRPRGRR